MIVNIDIGKVIKNLRKFSNMSQKDLAEGICTQAHISKIENSNEVPSAILLYQLAKKLGVDMNYFFDIAENPRLDYIRDVYHLIRYYIRERDYEAVHNIIKAEQKNPLFFSTEHKQFFLWHEAICEFYLNKNDTKSIEKLNFALRLTYYSRNRLMKEREIEISNSIAILYKEKGDYDEAITLYNSLLEHIRLIENPRDLTIRLRIEYGLGKAYTDIGEYEKSLDICKKGISYALKNEVLYLLGELYYQCASNYFRLDDFLNGDIYIKKSITTFDIQGNDKMVESVKLMEIHLKNTGTLDIPAK